MEAGNRIFIQFNKTVIRGSDVRLNIYDFKVKDIRGNDVSMSDYKGKVLLIVNTATGCGFTPQYDGLEKLYEMYKEKGFEILDFPCNQFLNQAPGTNEEIAQFCQLRFGTNFKTFAKIDVNGKNAEPLFEFLKKEVSEEIKNKDANTFKEKLGKLGNIILGNDIKWNFTKFLIDKNGKVIKRFSPVVTPEEIIPHIENLFEKEN